MTSTVSEIRVAFDGEGAGAGELTWGQMALWRATKRNNRPMNLASLLPQPEGTSLAEIAGMLRLVISRHPALRTRLRFVDGPSGDRHPQQVIAGSGEMPLHIIDIGDGDDPAAAAAELCSRYTLAWFDYENEFPVRLGVIRQSGAPVQLVVCYSHVMVDGAGISALYQDLGHLDQVTGEAIAPAEGLNSLELARWQGSPAGRRQSERAIKHWAAQLGRLSDWRLAEPARRPEPRFAELMVYSPAMDIGIRAVAARTGAYGISVLLAAYSVAVARVFGRDPSVAQLTVSNRFRPGFAGLVSQVAQNGICVVDAAGASFDEVVARAHEAAMSASFYAYYDPVACDRLLDEIAARRGQPPDIYWCINDLRGTVRPAGDDDEVPTKAELARALPLTRLYWNRRVPVSDATLFLFVDSQPHPADVRAQAGEPSAVYMRVWTDTWHFELDQVEALVREMEAVVVAATFDAQAMASRG